MFISLTLKAAKCSVVVNEHLSACICDGVYTAEHTGNAFTSISFPISYVHLLISFSTLTLKVTPKEVPVKLLLRNVVTIFVVDLVVG